MRSARPCTSPARLNPSSRSLSRSQRRSGGTAGWSLASAWLSEDHHLALFFHRRKAGDGAVDLPDPVDPSSSHLPCSWRPPHARRSPFLASRRIALTLLRCPARRVRVRLGLCWSTRALSLPPGTESPLCRPHSHQGVAASAAQGECPAGSAGHGDPPRGTSTRKIFRPAQARRSAAGPVWGRTASLGEVLWRSRRLPHGSQLFRPAERQDLKLTGPCGSTSTFERITSTHGSRRRAPAQTRRRSQGGEDQSGQAERVHGVAS